MDFTSATARALSCHSALTPNTVYTSNGGASSGKMTAYVLNGSATGGPTTMVAKLTQNGTIPDYPSIKTIKFTSARAVTFKKGKTHFLCETELRLQCLFVPVRHFKRMISLC